MQMNIKRHYRKFIRAPQQSGGPSFTNLFRSHHAVWLCFHGGPPCRATILCKHLFMGCMHLHLASGLGNLDGFSFSPLCGIFYGICVLIETYPLCVRVALARRLYSWRAHVSARLWDSQFSGLRVRPIFLALPTP